MPLICITPTFPPPLNIVLMSENVFCDPPDGIPLNPQVVRKAILQTVGQAAGPGSSLCVCDFLYKGNNLAATILSRTDEEAQSLLERRDNLWSQLLS